MTPTGPAHATSGHTDAQLLFERSVSNDPFTGAMHCEPTGSSWNCEAVQPNAFDQMWSGVQSEFWYMSYDQRMDIMAGRFLSSSLNAAAQDLIAANPGIF